MALLDEFELKYPAAKKRIVCLSDGEDNDSTVTPVQLITRLLESKVVVDSFIVGDKSEMLKCLTFATGGSCFSPATI